MIANQVSSGKCFNSSSRYTLCGPFYVNYASVSSYLDAIFIVIETAVAQHGLAIANLLQHSRRTNRLRRARSNGRRKNACGFKTFMR